MALDFPSSPTNGQVYGNFIWSSAKGAWQAKPITGKVTTSATAPSAPSNGDEWFNTNDGNLYLYYTDVDGSQWVQVKSDATLSSTLGNRVELLEAKPTGLVPVVPTSVSVGSGSATVNSNGEITFTNVSSVSLNGVFTSNYKNYRLMYVGSVGASANGELRARYRSAGSDYSAGQYYQAANIVSINGATNTFCGTALSYAAFSETATTTLGPDYYSGSMDIRSPQLAKFTTLQAQDFAFRPGTGESMYNITNQLANSSQYDGITMYLTTGTMTGTLQVYGYRNS